MACKIYRDKNGEIEKVLAPNDKDSLLYKSLLDLTKDPEKSLRLWAQSYTPIFKRSFGDFELLEQAKKLKSGIKGFYKDIATDENMEQVLFEASVQTHSSRSEAKMAMEIFGEGLIDISVTLFPDAKVGDKYKSKFSDNLDENGEPLLKYVLEFNSPNDKVYQSQQTFKDQLIGKLKNIGVLNDQGKISKENFERNIEKIEDINRKLGENIITMNDDGSINIDPNIEKFSDISIIGEDVEDDDDYQNYILDTIYGNNPEPEVKDVLYNVFTMVTQLGREDLKETTRLIQNYILLNPNLTIELIDDFTKDNIIHGINPNFMTSSGFYHAGLNKIYIDKSKVQNQTLEKNIETTLEELLHAITVQPYKKDNPNEQEKKYIDGVRKLYDEYLDKLNYIKVLDEYRFSDEREFIVGMMLDKNFKQFLNSVDSYNKKESFFKNLWNRFVNLVMNLIGIKGDVKIDKQYDQMMPIIEDYLSSRKSPFNLVIDSKGSLISNSILEEEKRSIKDGFNQEYHDNFKTKITTLIDYLKAVSTTKSSIDAEDSFMFMIREAKKLNENIIDELDYFMSFTREFSAVTNLAYDKIREVEKSDVDDAQKIRDYFRVYNTIRSYEPIINMLKEIKEQMPDGIPLKKSIENIIIKSEAVGTRYMTDILPLISNQAVDVLDQPSQIALEQNNKELDYLKKRLETTSNKKLVEDKINQLEKQNREKFTINQERIKNYLQGRYGDSSFISGWAEAAIVNGNPVISSVAKITRDSLNEVGVELLPIYNEFQTQVEEYEKAIGISKNKISAFNEPLLTSYDIIDGYNEKGELNKVKQKALLSPFNNEHISQIQKYAYEIGELSRRIREAEETDKPALEKERKNLILERRQWVKDYMEQPYLEEVHRAMEMMEEDLGGFSAKEYVGDLYEQLQALERALDAASTDEQTDVMYDQYNAIDFEIKRLRSLYEKEPGSREYKVAEQLKKYDNEISKYREFILTPKGQKKFDREKQRVDEAYDRREISLYDKLMWYQKNVTTTYKQSYWDEKKSLLDSLANIREKLGVVSKDKSDINQLYKDIESIAKAYRDNDGIINGFKVSEKDAQKIKSIEQQIENLKEEVADLFGLTKKDKEVLKNLYSQLDDFDYRLMLASSNPGLIDQIQQQAQPIRDKIAEITSKKKDLDKKLVKEYYELINKLSKLDETINTHYYEEAKNIELEKIKDELIVKLPESFNYDGSSYKKIADNWIQQQGNVKNIVPEAYVVDKFKSIRADTILQTIDWYLDNHISRKKYVKNKDYNQNDPESSPGEWMDVIEPIYIWRHTEPADKSKILKEQPGMRYKRAKIKDEFKNLRYKESIDGYNVPKTIGAKDDKYLNKEYHRMKNGTEREKSIIKYADFLAENYSKYQHSIPRGYRLGYAIPKIRKSNTERIIGTTAEDVKSRFKDWFTSFKQEVTDTPQDKDILYGYNDTMTTIPVRYTGNIDYDDQTNDVTRAILMFVADVAARNKLVETFPYVASVRNILSLPENKPVKIDSKGQVVAVVRKFLGKNKMMSKLIPGESMMYKQVDEFIRSYYFGEHIKDEAIAKPVNAVLGMGAKVLLGMNFIGSVVNRGNAWTQSLLETESKNGLFNVQEMLKAQMIYDSNIPKLIGDLGKYGNQSYITQFVNYFGGSNFSIIDKANDTLAYAKLTKGFSKVFVPNEMAEHAIGYQLFISAALNYKVQKDGKNISLFDAFEIKNRKFQLKDGVEFTNKDRKLFVNKLNAAARRINGNYNKLDKLLVQKYTMGRLTLFMNQYFIPFFVKRFGNKRFSAEDGISNAGFWRVFGKTVFKDLWTYQRNILSNWKDYTDEERTAVLQTLSEIGFSVGIIIAIAALGGDEPNDIKDNGVLVNNLIYTLKMLKRQNEQFMLVPGLGLDDIYSKIKSPLPIAGKIGNLFSLLNNSMYYMGYKTGVGGIDEKDVYYMKDSGWHKQGELKMGTDLSRLFGIIYRMHQIANPGIALQNMDAYRIK